MQTTTSILTGQAAIVTGASSGIGAAIAKELAAQGARVLVNYASSPAGAEAVVAAIKGAGGEAFAVQADVSQESQVEAMFAAAVDRFGALDICVSNAGIQQDAPLVDMTLDQWNRVLEINLTGAFLCFRAAARQFLKQGPRPEVSRALGKLLCVSSVHERIPWAGHVNYAASKGGAALLMQSVAQELGPAGVRVNSICPGAIRTPINRLAWETPEAMRDLLALIPYKRIGEPEDIARVAAWLVSDQADYVHGASLFVDGGMTLYPGFADGG